MSKVAAVWDAASGAVSGQGINSAVTLLQPQQGINMAENGVEQNAFRAWRAALAVRKYGFEAGIAVTESAYTCVSDLVNDLHHLCDALAIDWDDVSRPYHYDEEIVADQDEETNL